MNNATISLTIFHITRQGEICRFVGNKLWFCSSIKTLIENIALFSLKNPCKLLKSLQVFTPPPPPPRTAS